MEQPEFVTVYEVAQRLRVSIRSVYRLIEAGELRAIRVGRLIRIPAGSLEAYLRRQGLGGKEE